MKIHVPENLGGDLKVLPEGPCTASIDNITLGTSKAGKPKATVRYILTSEMYKPEDGQSSVGEVVLETFSLQPQALWNLNSLFKDCTGDSIPQGDHEPAELESILQEGLIGQEFNLILETVPNNEGVSQTQVTSREKV